MTEGGVSGLDEEQRGLEIGQKRNGGKVLAGFLLIEHFLPALH